MFANGGLSLTELRVTTRLQNEWAPHPHLRSDVSAISLFGQCVLVSAAIQGKISFIVMGGAMVFDPIMGKTFLVDSE